MKIKYLLLVFSAFIILGPLVLVGCYTIPTPPFIPLYINAKLPTSGAWTDMSSTWCISSEFDTSVLVYLDSISEYAKQSKGYWIHQWYICKMKKISTIKGIFDEEELSFFYRDSWPSPTAPFRIEKMPFPYRERMVFLLGINTTKKPFEIICHEQRSWVAPYGMLKKPSDNIHDFDKIMDSVMCFLNINIDDTQIQKTPELHLIVSKDMGYLEIVEEAEEYYIVYANLVDKTATVMVNRNTLEVKYLPEPPLIPPEVKGPVTKKAATEKHPVRKKRKTLKEIFKAESFEECFMNTASFSNLSGLFFTSELFVPGRYNSDVRMIYSTDRMRKLVEFTKRNPGKYAEFLMLQIDRISKDFDKHFVEYLEKAKKIKGPQYLDDLPQYEKDRIRLTVAAYLLSEINASESLPTLLSLSKINNVRRPRDEYYYQYDEESAGTWPINSRFLIFSMHCLMINYPEDLLNEQGLQARAEYLKKADQLQIVSPTTVYYPTWDSPYRKEGPWRHNMIGEVCLEIPEWRKREMYISMTVYPSDTELDGNDVNALLDKLENFCAIEFPGLIAVQ